MNPELLRASSPKDNIIDAAYMAQQIFKLSDSAVTNVMSKKTSLLYEVSAVCTRWHEERSHLPMPRHVPVEYASETTLIGPCENFLEVEIGVFYLLERGTVIKFLSNPSSFADFVLEAKS